MKAFSLIIIPLYSLIFSQVSKAEYNPQLFGPVIYPVEPNAGLLLVITENQALKVNLITDELSSFDQQPIYQKKSLWIKAGRQTFFVRH